MKLFAVHSVIWTIFLGLSVSQSETEFNNHDVCGQSISLCGVQLHTPSSSEDEDIDDENDVNGTVSCLLYPENVLNCSWSFQDLQKDEQLSIHISVCGENGTTDFWNSSSKERDGFKYLDLSGNFEFFVIQYNVSLHDRLATSTCMYEVEMIEVLSPPSNICASVDDKNLKVTWNLPGSHYKTDNPKCFEYQLDLGDQEGPRYVTEKLFYEELNDPTRRYSVRIRARNTVHCSQSLVWSNWSHTVILEPSIYNLKMLVIVLISLGIPMILLAVLLLVRHQRVTELLFPPIPGPPPKYIYFLEKNDLSSFVHLAQPAKVEEEITEVQETKENAEKTL